MLGTLLLLLTPMQCSSSISSGGGDFVLPVSFTSGDSVFCQGGFCPLPNETACLLFVTPTQMVHIRKQYWLCRRHFDRSVNSLYTTCHELLLFKDKDRWSIVKSFESKINATFELGLPSGRHLS